MTYGIKALRKVQIGAESTAGTPVSATNVLIGEGTLQDDREVVFQKGDVGSFLGNMNTRTAKLGGTLEFDQEASFEQIGYVFQASVTTAAAVQDGAGSDYIYTYSAPKTAPTTIQTYTLQAGDNISTDVDQMQYSYASSWTLSGKGGEPLQLKTTWKGRQVALSSDDGFTNVAVPSVEAILFSRGSIDIDNAVGGTIGTTTADGELLAFELKYDSGFKEVFTADGLDDPYFAFVKSTAPAITCDFTFEHDNTVAPLVKSNWRAETTKLIRMKFIGSTAATTGTAWSGRTLQIDMYGKWLKIEKLDEIDGDDVIKGTFQVGYDSTGTSYSLEIVVVNELNGLT